MAEDNSGLLSLLERYAARSEAEALDVATVMSLVDEGAPWARSSPLHATASALILHPPSGRVLLRWHERQQAWLQIGGHADAGEDDALAVAIREGLEEAGLTDLRPWPSADLQHLVIVPVPANAREPAHRHADLRFFLATGQPELARPERPEAQLRWLTLDEALRLTTEDNVRETIHRAAAVLSSR